MAARVLAAKPEKVRSWVEEMFRKNRLEKWLEGSV
jgi:hypothetical protein